MKCFAVVAEMEFEVYLEVTDDKGHVDLWTYKSDKLGNVLKRIKASEYTIYYIWIFICHIKMFV